MGLAPLTPASQISINDLPQRLFPWRALMAVAIILGVGLRLANLGNVATPTDDEQVYTRQANTWLLHGQPGLRALVEEYKRDPVARYFPMPTRAGMIRLLAVTMRITDRNDETVGRLISAAASISSLLVAALIGLRFLPAGAGAVGLLLYAVFPPELAIARRTWTDALVEFAALVLVWLVLEITRQRHRRIWYLLFAAVGSISMTVKESVPVPYAACTLWILWVTLKHREWANALYLTVAGAIGCAITVWWLSFMAGSFTDLVSIVSGITKVNAANPYAIEYASGPGYLLLDALWIVSPLVALLSIVGLFAVLLRAPELTGYAGAALWIAVFTLVNIAIAMILPHWLNLRYISVAFGPYCLLAGIGWWYPVAHWWKRVRPGSRPVVIGLASAILLSAAVSDYMYFHQVFVRNGTGDLSVKMLRDQRLR